MFRSWSTFALCLIGASAVAGDPKAVPPLGEPKAALALPALADPKAAPPASDAKASPLFKCDTPDCAGRRLFESDRAFPTFVGPISNPILAKDPRALTEARALFVQNWIPDEHNFRGGDLQVYGLQLRLAVTERLSIIADKDGYASISPGNARNTNGWLDMAFGMKYALVRDVENQFLVVGGFQYEPNMGESDVFQNHGDGVFSVFGIVGKKFCGDIHAIANFGYQFPVDKSENSSFFYSQLHVDKQFLGWLSPLVEVNWLHYTQGGNYGLPASLGEGDGLINLGTSGVAGNDLVTIAAGVKAQVNRHLDVGVAYETPLSNRKDLIDNRILVEMIFRY